MKYEVDTKFVFSGKFTVMAENEEQAKKLVKESCGLVIGGNIHTTLLDENCNWHFSIHPDTVIGKVRRTK